MFSFFQKNVYLQDLIPPEYVDIHSHLLPGIDDGAQKFEDTTLLLKGLADIGFSEFVTTPHIMHNVYENTFKSVTELHKKTVEDLAGVQFNAPFRAAAEYMLDDNFMTHLHSGSLLTLADKYVLIEMSYLNPPLQLFDIIFDIQVAGYIPVLAHPERYNFYHTNFGQYQKLKNAGCKFQVNLLSTVGYYGSNVMQAASKLLHAGLIDFTGSDVHHEKHLNAFAQKLSVKNSEPLKEAMKNNHLFKIKNFV